MKRIKIGTRRSIMARTQCQLVAESIRAIKADINLEEVVILSSGDKKQGTEAANFGDKRDWIDGFEVALIEGGINFAVHCGKDVPVEIEPSLEICSIMERWSPFDVFVGRKINDGKRIKFSELPNGAIVGTASLRRSAELLRLRPDLKIVAVRGNVPTRLEKLDAADSDLAGLVLAEAGFERLKLDYDCERFSEEQILPAVNQGILAAEFKEDDSEIKLLLSELRNENVEFAFKAERQLVRLLEADCGSALGVYASVDQDKINLRCRVLSKDGKIFIDKTETGSVSEYLEVANTLAEKLFALGAKELLHCI